MDVLAVARGAFRIAWGNKRLWLFGVFVAATTGGGRGSSGGAAAALPGWVLGLAGVALVLGSAALWMHVVSEGALIEGAGRLQMGAMLGTGEAFRSGRASFGRVLRLKVGALCAIAVAALVLASPAVMIWLHVLPMVAGVWLTGGLLVVATPWLLTGYFVYAYALRFTVLEGLEAGGAILAAWRYLPGRVLESLKLLALAFAGQIVAALAGAVAVLPGVGLGTLIFVATGSMTWAVATGCVLALPPGLAVAGIVGTFRSAVWTLGFLESREAERA